MTTCRKHLRIMYYDKATMSWRCPEDGCDAFVASEIITRARMSR